MRPRRITSTVSRYDLVGLAMQEPQYTNHTIRVLMIKIAAANLPCLSIMNMPPLPISNESRRWRPWTSKSVYQRPGMGTLQTGIGDPLLA